MTARYNRPSIERACQALLEDTGFRFEKFWPGYDWNEGWIEGIDSGDNIVGADPNDVYLAVRYQDGDCEDLEWESFANPEKGDVRFKVVPPDAAALLQELRQEEEGAGGGGRDRRAALRQEEEGAGTGGQQQRQKQQRKQQQQQGQRAPGSGGGKRRGRAPVEPMEDDTGGNGAGEDSNVNASDGRGAPGLRGKRSANVAASGAGGNGLGGRGSKRAKAAVHHNPERDLEDWCKTHGIDKCESDSWFGHLKQVRIQNFMCHENYCWDLGPRVNFVSGQNGSGKSASLQALQAALGVAARKTGRGSSLKEYVRKAAGVTQARIWVDIWNTGTEAIDFEKYGAWITIQRTITQSGGAPFKIFNMWGEEVGSKRDEVDTILEAFNIDAENPVVVMTQDTARTFAQNQSPENLFKLFEDSLHFSDTVESLKEAKTNCKAAIESVKVAKSSLQGKQKELQHVSDQIELLTELDTWNEQSERLVKYMQWQKVHLERKDVQAIGQWLESDHPDAYPAIKAKVEGHVQQRREELAAREQEVREHSKTLDDVLPRMTALQNEMDAKHHEKNSRRKELNAAAAAVRRAQEMRAQREAELQQLTLHHREQAEAVLQATQAAQTDFKQQLETRRQAAEAAGVAASDAHQVLKECTTVMAAREREHAAAAAAHSEALQRVQGLESERRRLQDKKAMQGAERFGGPGAAQLQRLVEEAAAQGRFVRKPIGPLGCELALEDDSWGAAVEVALGAWLNSFVADNLNDNKLLRELAQRARHNVRTVVSSFSHPLHIIPPNRTLHDVPTLMSVLAFKEGEAMHVVKNVLVDMASIERAALAVDETAGLGLLSSHPQRGVISNVYCADGGRCWARGSNTSYQPNYRKSHPRLVKSVEHVRQQVERELQEAQAATDAACQERHRAKRAWDEAKREEEQAKARRRHVVREKHTAETQLEDLRQHGPGGAGVHQEAGGADVIEARLKELQDEITNLQLREESSLDRQRELEQQVAALAQEHDALRNDTATLVQENERLQETVGQRMQRQQEAMHALANMEGIVAALEVKREEERQKLETAKEHLRAALHVAQQYSTEEEFAKVQEKVHADFPRVAQAPETDRVNAAAHERQHLERKMNRREQDAGGSLEQLQATKEKLQDMVSKMQLRVERADENAKSLSNGYKSRNAKLRRMRDKCADEVALAFQRFLKRKGWGGELNVDYEQKKLLLAVTTDEGKRVDDLKSLSGGERSFMTLCFVLAIGCQIGSPLHAMDEYDVFMDPIIRTVSTTTLLRVAWDMPDTQFIFLTPQDMSVVDKAKQIASRSEKLPNGFPDHFVRVFRMKPARGGSAATAAAT